MIGWREVSRKLLLYLSDAGFHFAGDGLVSMLATHPDLLFTQITWVYKHTQTHTHTHTRASRCYNYTLRFSCAFASTQLGGVVQPHDGQCHMEDLQPDRLTGNIVYQHWNRLVTIHHLIPCLCLYVMALITGLPLNWTNRRKAVRI